MPSIDYVFEHRRSRGTQKHDYWLYASLDLLFDEKLEDLHAIRRFFAQFLNWLALIGPERSQLFHWITAFSRSDRPEVTD